VQGEALREFLEQFEGRWQGDYTIHSASTNYSETFPVEQRYWFEGAELVGISVADTDRGLQTARSRTMIENGQLRSVIQRGETTERYLGTLHDGGVVWLPEDRGRVTDHQMRQTFAQRAGKRWLNTDGFDTFLSADGLAHLVYRGRLSEVPQEEPVTEGAEAE
jgi:hypothetical protein